MQDTVGQASAMTFTFHYVSISTATKNFGNISTSKFTFHHVSISTIRWRNDVYLIVIYIPLCIYFNLEFFVSEFKTASIYIPLCIYFNIMNNTSGCSWFINLHSTMYLFQPELQTNLKTKKMVFTFHYVSISTCLFRISLLSRLVFTFHYVSISTSWEK